MGTRTARHTNRDGLIRRLEVALGNLTPADRELFMGMIKVLGQVADPVAMLETMVRGHITKLRATADRWEQACNEVLGDKGTPTP